MNKVIIIDDRLERRKVLMSEKKIEELKNCEIQGWLTSVTELPTSSFELETALSEYSMIAIHRSWMVDHSVENIIEDYIRRTNKFYIVYSGGISQNLLLNGWKRLNMNAANFYSANLPTIIKKYALGESQYPLLELLYGESWKLSILLAYRNLLWLGGMKYNQAREEELRRLLIDGSFIPDEQITMEEIGKEIEKEKYKYVML